jgi:hypothetical protein
MEDFWTFLSQKSIRHSANQSSPASSCVRLEYVIRFATYSVKATTMTLRHFENKCLPPSFARYRARRIAAFRFALVPPRVYRGLIPTRGTRNHLNSLDVQKSHFNGKSLQKYSQFQPSLYQSMALFLPLDQHLYLH